MIKLPPRDAPFLLALAGVVAWLLGSILAFTHHGDGPASAFIGSGLVLLLVSAYFDRIEEAGPGGIKVGPQVRPVPSDDTQQALEPTLEERDVEPPAGTTPKDEPTIVEGEDVRTFENLADLPGATVAALYESVDELATSEARFQRATRRRGRGNFPWLFEYAYPNGTTKTWRVSWGGKRKRSATVDRHTD